MRPTRRTAAQVAGWLLAVAMSCIARDAVAEGVRSATDAHAATGDSIGWMTPHVGDRVRLTTSAKHADAIVGRVVRTDDSSITLVTEESSGDQPATVATIERNSIGRIEWHDGYASRDLSGIVLGFAAGGVLGAIIAGAGKSESYTGYVPSWYVGASVGSMLGLIAGWMIGAANPGERWSSTPSDGLGLRDPGDGPVQLTFRTSF